jgi:hypothetical protein
MKHIKTFENNKNVNDSILLFKSLNKAITDFYKELELIAHDVTQVQDDRIVSYLRKVNDPRYPFLESDQNYSFIRYYNNKYIEIRHFNLGGYDNLNIFIRETLKSFSIDSHKDNIFDILVSDVQRLIDKLSIENYNVFCDSKKYNI